MSTPKTRTEHDLIGTKDVPADAYYGVQTARALENFHISGLQLVREKKVLTEQQIADVLNPAAMTGRRPS